MKKQTITFTALIMASRLDSAQTQNTITMKTLSVALSTLFTSLLLTALTPDSHAQGAGDGRYNQPIPKKWGVEADLLVPFVPEANIITVRATRTIVGRPDAAHGDLLLGVYLRPNVTHNIVDKIDEYLLTAGYRQYLFKGFHIEGQVDTGWARGTHNKIDGKDYENFTVLVEGHAGYKFSFRSKRSYNLYLLPQVGIIQGAITNIGPRGSNSDTFLSAKVNIGIAF